MMTLCCCGYRRGLHRYGDEVCPNPAWMMQPGNGQPQWSSKYHFAPHPAPQDVQPTVDRKLPA